MSQLKLQPTENNHHRKTQQLSLINGSFWSVKVGADVAVVVVYPCSSCSRACNCEDNVVAVAVTVVAEAPVVVVVASVVVRFNKKKKDVSFCFPSTLFRN